MIVAVVVATVMAAAGEAFVSRWPKPSTARPLRGALMGVSAGACAWIVTHGALDHAPRLVTGSRGVLCGAMVILAVVDWRVHRLPDVITLPTFVITAVMICFGGGPVLHAFIGAGVYFAALGIIHVIKPSGMGFGDVKLALGLGLQLGWLDVRLVLHGLTAASLFGVLIGMVQIGRKRGKAFAFGPAMCAGTVVVIALSSRILASLG